MNLEETLTRSLHDRLDGLEAPHVDIEAVRRSGERRRAATRAGMIGAGLALLVGAVALATALPEDGAVQPVELPGMDFDPGARAYYDESRKELHLGGEAFDIGKVDHLDLGATATPYGVVFFADDQAAWLVAEDGEVRRIAEAPESPRSFSPRVKVDAEEPVAAWLTRGSEGVELTLFELGDDEGVLGTASVPCEGQACARLQVAGVDSGRVFVREPRGDTLVFDMDDLDGAPAVLASYTVADVRNRVVLGEGEEPGPDVLGTGWRFAPARGPDSLLTFDGGHEVSWQPWLRATDGGAPARLDLPGKGILFLTVDSDGSVLAAEMPARSGPIVYYDCEVPSGSCQPIGELPRSSGDPVFLGADM